MVAPFHSAYLSAGIESPSNMAGLSATLANGITVKSATLVEKSRMVRYMAATRLNALHQLHPALLSSNAIDHPFKVEQDVTKITVADFKTLPAVTVVFATPPCQPFSKAGPTPGWDSEESKPFISCVNLIKELNNA